jgi:CRISPR system Cascade subunit CasA
MDDPAQAGHPRSYLALDSGSSTHTHFDRKGSWEVGVRFNLIDEPWIPVEAAGSVRELPLREVLVNAHNIDRLAAALGTMRVALLRLLVAIVIHAFGLPGTPEEWCARHALGHFEAGQLDRYLDDHHDRFDLFHVEVPFAQVVDLCTTRGETK